MEFTTLIKGSELKSLKLKVSKLGGEIVPKCSQNVAAVFAFQGIIMYYIFNLFFIIVN